MKPLLAIVCMLATALAAALATAWSLSAPPLRPGGHDAATTQALEELRSELASIARRLEALERTPAVARVERSNAPVLEPMLPATGPAGADWYLEQYVLSFATDAQGSEYFRLAVEAYVVELVSPIATLVRDAGRPVALRIALANMLGKRQFDMPEVVEALLAAVRAPAPEALALRALAALSRIGSTSALPGLEAALPALQEQPVREAALALLVELSGDAANEVLLRLYLRAPDDAMRRSLIRLLNEAELQSSLQLLRAASGAEQPVRLDAARKVREYDEPAFDAFAAEWLQNERDAQVIAALGGGKPKEAPGWSARQAIGAPDADPRQDDRNAWASKSPDMGLQWLQLTYATPARANAIRVFEVNSPGALAEVLARAADGSWITLWRGQANGGGQPLLIQFPLTSAVATIRLVLDTNRTPGWNEIDAVELIGPGGSQWASRASASSSYSSGGGDPVSANREFERALLLQGATRR